MHILLRTSRASVLCLVFLLVTTAYAQTHDVVGEWRGTLTTGQGDFSLIVQISKTNGVLS